MDFWAPLETEDPEIAQVVRDEEERTRSHLELIASPRTTRAWRSSRRWARC